MRATGGDIIRLKDRIHTLWFELQQAKRANPKYSFLLRSIYDEIVRVGHEALSILKEIEPNSPFITRIAQPLHEVQRKSWVVEDITTIAGKPYYVMTPEAGQSVITQDINRLANQVHHAGMSLIQAREEYCGCEVLEEDISSINTGVLKYCEGALRRWGKTALILSGGDKVEHRPGSAANHANTIRFIPTEKGHEIEMEYIESGDANWPHRQDGVTFYVKKRGGNCEVAGTIAKCHIPNLSEDEILKLALMISQLKDIDLMSSDCIPLAFQLIEQQADELRAVEPKKDIWDEPWTVVSDMTDMMQCQGRRYEAEEERKNREEILGRRLRDDIEAMDDAIEHALEHSKKDTCTSEPYTRLANVKSFPGEIYDACKEIKTKTIDPFGWCQDLAKQRDREIVDAAKDLINRCPPEGIILAAEAIVYPYTIDQIARICELAENQDCLDIIKQVEARAQAGIVPGILKLKPREEVSVPA